MRHRLVEELQLLSCTRGTSNGLAQLWLAVSQFWSSGSRICTFQGLSVFHHRKQEVNEKSKVEYIQVMQHNQREAEGRHMRCRKCQTCQSALCPST